MYTIEIPHIINQIYAVFYGLGMWDIKDRITIYEILQKLFHVIYYLSFLTSTAIGAIITDDLDDFVFSTAIAIIATVQLCRLFVIIWKKDEILMLVNQSGLHFTEELGEFIQVNKKLKKFERFVKYVILALLVEAFLMLIFPIFFRGKLLISSAFYWQNSQISFWIIHIHTVLGCTHSIVCILLSVIVCYLMINCAIKYEMLGNRLKNMGADTNDPKVSKTEHQQLLFLKDLIDLIEAHQNIILMSNNIYAIMRTS